MSASDAVAPGAGDDEPVCAICLCAAGSATRASLVLNRCGHVFHVACERGALLHGHARCALCRQPLDFVQHDAPGEQPRVRVSGLSDAVVSTRSVTLLFELYGASPRDEPARRVWLDGGSASARGSYDEWFATVNGFCTAWAARCAVAENAALVPLRRAEGGLTAPGDDSKCVRFAWLSGDIMARPCGAWTLIELLDLKDAFKALMNARLEQVYGPGDDERPTPSTRARLQIE